VIDRRDGLIFTMKAIALFFAQADAGEDLAKGGTVGMVALPALSVEEFQGKLLLQAQRFQRFVDFGEPVVQDLGLGAGGAGIEKVSYLAQWNSRLAIDQDPVQPGEVGRRVSSIVVDRPA